MESNQVYTSQSLTDYLVPSNSDKTNSDKGGVVTVYFLSIQSKRFVALMNKIVVSVPVLFQEMLS